MKQNPVNHRSRIRDSIIILLSAIGLMACIAVFFPQVSGMIMDLAEQIVHKKASTYQSWLKALVTYAMGGIFFILVFDYCTLTKSGRLLVQQVKQEMKDCLSEIDLKVFLKPLVLMFVVYLLGALTIIRANIPYLDDMGRSVAGYRDWYGWSRYVSELLSIFIHGDTHLTDISPVPQLLAVLILSVGSVLLVYVIGNKKITPVRLLASVPLGLSPYFLDCLAFKFDAPYMALSILASIVPFLFIARKKAFIFCSVISLLIMCTTYQASSGIYVLITMILCFQNWNSRQQSNKEILSFLGTAAVAFCFAMALFRFFLMKPADYYTSTAMHPIAQIVSGTLKNINRYAMSINHDLGMIWKIGIAIVLFFFILKSLLGSMQKKIFSFFVSIAMIGLSFVLSFGAYLLLAIPLYDARAMYGFGVFLSIFCVYVVSGYKKPAIVAVLALNWCFFVFAFSFGNALADQARYADFRISLLLHDLSVLYPNRSIEDMRFQLKNSIDYAPSVTNIAKHYPIIEKLVQKRLGEETCWDTFYFLDYFNFGNYRTNNAADENFIDFSTLNLPVVADSYYHTIQSDGNRVLVVLKH